MFLTIEQPLKALAPMDVTLFGITNVPTVSELSEDKALQSKNALDPIVSTELLMVNLLNEMQPLNRAEGMIEMLGKLISSILEQFSKLLMPTCIMPSFKLIFVSIEQFWNAP